jgi:D-beta-D-heptose 7-phosphate kinase/D-beta-D-heptose 1-phosphate adenosyltransferase
MTDSSHRLTTIASAFPSVRVLCVGDIMLDRYVYGRVNRISPEAPVPVIAVDREQAVLGAVGNVARNVAALGGRAVIVAVVGDDDGGGEIARLIAEEGNLEGRLVTVPGRRTTIKTRYLAVQRGGQMLRADHEDTHPLDDRTMGRLIEAVRAAIAAVDVVLLSDYSKGCLNDAVLRATIAAAREAGTPIIADPKTTDVRRFDGVDVVKPNAKELEAITGIPCIEDEDAATSATAALDRAQVGAVLVTRSKHGMTLAERGSAARHFRARISEVFDVSGAGDTALAVLGLATGAGASLPEATELANQACSIVVSKVGTAVVHTGELVRALQSAEFATAEAKVNPLSEVVDTVARWRTQGAVIGFTNGCFDLIHAGHVSLLTQAKANCDRLVVGLNSDDSVRRLKGADRPINNETARAIVLASLSAVDAVVLFAEDTPMHLIEAIRPDVLVKGADYGEDDVVGAPFVKSYGGRVVLAQLAPEHSTTRTINRIRE